MTPLTYEQAKAVQKRLAQDDAPVYAYVRRYAAEEMLQDWPEGEGLGTSDVSVQVTEMLRFYEIPLVGPVVAAYVACGFPVPDHDQHGAIVHTTVN